MTANDSSIAIRAVGPATGNGSPPDPGHAAPRVPRQRRAPETAQSAGSLPGAGICLAVEVDGTIGFAGRPPGPDSLAALIEVGAAGVRTIAVTHRMPAEITGWFDDADHLEVLCAGGAIHLPAAASGRAALVRSIPADLMQRMVRELVLADASCLLEYADHRVLIGTASPDLDIAGDGGAPGPIPVTRLAAGVAPQWTGVVRMVIGESRRWATRMRRISGERLTVLARPDGSVHILAAGCTPAAAVQRLISPAASELHSAGLHSAGLHSAGLHSAELHSAELHSAGLRSTELHSAELPTGTSAGSSVGTSVGRIHRRAAAESRPMLVVCGSSTDALSMLSVAEIGVVVGDGLTGIDRLRHVRRVPAFDRRAAGGIRTAVRKAMRHRHDRPMLVG